MRSHKGGINHPQRVPGHLEQTDLEENIQINRPDPFVLEVELCTVKNIFKPWAESESDH
jgi:hypothetical protein